MVSIGCPAIGAPNWGRIQFGDRHLIDEGRGGRMGRQNPHHNKWKTIVCELGLAHKSCTKFAGDPGKRTPIFDDRLCSDDGDISSHRPGERLLELLPPIMPPTARQDATVRDEAEPIRRGSNLAGALGNRRTIITLRIDTGKNGFHDHSPCKCRLDRGEWPILVSGSAIWFLPRIIKYRLSLRANRNNEENCNNVDLVSV